MFDVWLREKEKKMMADRSWIDRQMWCDSKKEKRGFVLKFQGPRKIDKKRVYQVW